ncbi:MAG: two component system response regulator [Enterobacteriaceae bacterium]
MTMSLRDGLKILVVDDHALISDGIRICLEPYPEFKLVGVVQNGLTVYEQCIKLKPDLVFMDLMLPGMDGINVIRQLHKRWPEMLIIVLSAREEEKSAREALLAGARGYVLKKSGKSVLLAAIDSVVKKHLFLDPALDQSKIHQPDRQPEGELELLTPREQQILKLISEGKRNRDIADVLSISQKTVETHRMNLMRKLNAHNIAELIQNANRLGV